MSIMDEMESPDDFDRLYFVEFLEFLGRLADFLFEDIRLPTKLEMTLDKILKSHRFKRKEVEKFEESDSSASED